MNLFLNDLPEDGRYEPRHTITNGYVWLHVQSRGLNTVQ
jgi:hypothetical protein